MIETERHLKKQFFTRANNPPRARLSQALSSCMTSQSIPRSCFPQQLTHMFPYQPWPTASQQQLIPRSFQVPEPASLDPTMSFSSTHPVATGDRSTVAPTHSDSCLDQRSRGQHASHATMGALHTTTTNLPLHPDMDVLSSPQTDNPIVMREVCLSSLKSPSLKSQPTHKVPATCRGISWQSSSGHICFAKACAN